MNAAELYKQGSLSEAIEAQTTEVKKDPGDPNKRVFLFELLLFAGDLDRAGKQIDAVQFGEPERDAATAKYRGLVDAELARRKLFSDGIKPNFLEEQLPEHVELRLKAVDEIRNNQPEEAAKLLAQAQEKSPKLTGNFNGKPFEDLSDFDEVFGSVLEVLANGQYFWVPLEQVATVLINPPAQPRDIVWIPARLQMFNGEDGEVFLPAIYPLTYQETDLELKLGRKTHWSETRPVLGKGSRMYLVGEEDVPLLEWREVQIDALPEE